MDMKATFQAHAGRRRRAETRFVLYCRLSLGLAAAFLVFLFVNIMGEGVSAFRQAEVQVDVAWDAKFTNDPSEAYAVETLSLLSRSAVRDYADRLEANKTRQGQTAREWVLANAEADQFLKGKPSNLRAADKETLTRMKDEGRARLAFNWRFFTAGDSQHAELAGIMAAAIGSGYVILLTFLFSFPVGVMCALYLEEFAPDNRWTQIIEININNLAAVPSIIFGLLGLAIFINFMGMPRSSSLVGGLTLALMNLPVIIVVTRASIRAVPTSIKHAALSLGATPWQVAWDHTLPYSMPGILTGTIIGLARCMGETAPLLMVGMMANIPAPPSDFLSAATVLPAQIFAWSSHPVRAFTERTAASIICLIALLLTINGLAIWLRNRYERKW